MITNYTPRKWVASNTIVQTESGNRIFDTRTNFGAAPALDGDCANALLIASAPDLLGALEAMFNEYGDFEYNLDTLSMARAAIAKARGGAA